MIYGTETCPKNNKHDFKEIFNFFSGSHTTLSGFFKIYKCSHCKELKFIRGS